MCRSVVYDPATAEYVCLETGEVFGDRIVDLLPIRDWEHYSAERVQIDRSKRIINLSKLVLAYADELGVSEATREEALRLARRTWRKNFGMIRVNTVALALLYIAARNVDNTPVLIFCRKLGMDGASCRKFMSTVVHVSERIGVKLRQLDPTSTIVSYVNVLIDDESKRGEVVKLARELYEKAKPYVHISRAYLIAACVVYAMRQSGINIAFRRAAEQLGLSDSSISHAYAKLRELIEKKAVRL